MRYYLLFLFLLIFSFLPAYSSEHNSSKNIDSGEVEDQLSFYWDLYSSNLSSYPDSAFFYIQKVKSLSIAAKREDWLAGAYWAIGDFQHGKGYLGEAVFNYLEAAKIYNSSGELIKYADVNVSIGFIYILAKDYRAALSYFEQAKHIYIYERSNRDLAMVYRNLAVCYREMMENDKAMSLLERAMEVALSEKNYEGVSFILNMQGSVRFKQKAYGEARDKYRLAMQYSDSVKGNLRITAGAINNIGETFLYEEDYERAEKWLHDALLIKRKVNDPVFEQSTLNLLGRLYIELEQYERAIALLEEGLVKVDLTVIDDEVDKGLSLIIEALVKASAVGNPSKHAYLNQKFALYSRGLVTYNAHLMAQREELETIGKQQVVRLAVEKHSMNAKLGAAEEKNEKFKYAIIIPAFLLICAVISVYLSLRRNARYKKLYAGIEEVLGSRALKKPDIK